MVYEKDKRLISLRCDILSLQGLCLFGFLFLLLENRCPVFDRRWSNESDSPSYSERRMSSKDVTYVRPSKHPFRGVDSGYSPSSKHGPWSL